VTFLQYSLELLTRRRVELDGNIYVIMIFTWCNIVQNIMLITI